MTSRTYIYYIESLRIVTLVLVQQLLNFRHKIIDTFPLIEFMDYPLKMLNLVHSWGSFLCQKSFVDKFFASKSNLKKVLMLTKSMSNSSQNH